VDAASLDRSAFQISPLDEDVDEREYWWEKSPAERTEALELMRQIVLWLRSSYHPTSKSS